MSVMKRQGTEIVVGVGNLEGKMEITEKLQHYFGEIFGIVVYPCILYFFFLWCSLL